MSEDGTHGIGFLDVHDDGRVAFVSRHGVAMTAGPLPEPDPRLLDGLPRGSLTIDATYPDEG